MRAFRTGSGDAPASPETTDAAGARGKPRGGFAGVFREHSAPAVRLAHMLCGDRDMAEDCAADAFARTYPRWQHGDVEDVGAYLRRATVNAVRSRQRRMPLARRERRRRAGDHRGRLGPEDVVSDRALALELLSQLSDRERAAVVLRFWADVADADGAAALGCAVGTYRSLICRGLARLRGAITAASAGAPPCANARVS